MKIPFIGGNGTIGSRVAAHYAEGNEVIIAGRNSVGVKVDIADSNSIKTMFEKTGKVDAIICAAGEAKWAPLDELSEEDYYIGLRSKLMGQVNLVRIGRHHLNEPSALISKLQTGIQAFGNTIKFHQKILKIVSKGNYYQIDLVDNQTGETSQILSKKIVLAAGAYAGNLLQLIAPKYQEYFLPQRMSLSFFKIKQERYESYKPEQKKHS